MTAPYPATPYPPGPRPTGPQPTGQQPTASAADRAGGSGIDAALAALAEVKDAPPAQQVAPLTQAHRVLRETLESIGDV